MSNTNQIDIQLQQKADKFLEKKAKEITAIREDIEEMLGIQKNYIDYITDYSEYNEAERANKRDFVSYENPLVTQNKLTDELKENYKERLVTKYTKELINKLDLI